MKLEHLSLVSRICTELDNHLGINDKDLAEFIIDLAEKNTEFTSFKKVLLENGAEFPDSFITNLLRVIQLMKTSRSAPGKSIDTDDKKGKLVTKFPGLAMPNQLQEDMLMDERKDEKDKKMMKTVADDMMDELEALAPSKSTFGGESSTSVDKPEHSKDRKHRSTSRERKPDKHRKRSRSRSRDRKRSHSRERRRRSRSRDGDKHHRDGDRHQRDDGRGDRHQKDGDRHQRDGDRHHRDGDRHHRDRDRSNERNRDDRHRDDRHRDSRHRRSRYDD